MQKPAAISYAVFAAAARAGGGATPRRRLSGSSLLLSRSAGSSLSSGRNGSPSPSSLFCDRRDFPGFVFFLKRALVVLPEIVETAIPVVVKFAEQHGIELPFTDIDSLRASRARQRARRPRLTSDNYVKVATKEFVFLVVGVVIAVGVFLNPDFEPERNKAPAQTESLHVLHRPDPEARQLVLSELRDGDGRAVHHLRDQCHPDRDLRLRHRACATPASSLFSRSSADCCRSSATSSAIRSSSESPLPSRRSWPRSPSSFCVVIHKLRVLPEQPHHRRPHSITRCG